MGLRGEKMLIQHLLDPDSIAVIVAEGLAEEVVPTEAFHPIIDWTIDYYYRSGCQRAPSLQALRGTETNKTTFGDILDDFEVPIGEDPEDTIEWAIDDLKSTYVHKVSNDFNKRMATDMTIAEARDRVDVLSSYASELVGVSFKLTPRINNTDLDSGVRDALMEFEARKETQGQHRGLHFGLPEVDAHTFGIHDGELAVVGAGPKVGKSYFVDWVALNEWAKGRTVALFTLENSVAMTIDRIACMAAGVDPIAWQRGTAPPEAVAEIVLWQDEIAKADSTLWVLQPELGQRSFEHMVRAATLRDCDSLIVDQLSHVDFDESIEGRTRQIGHGLRRLKGLISTGRRRIPCLLAAQVNREGMKAAEKTGCHEMWHFAESAEIERTADHVYAMYASPDQRAFSLMLFQTIAARRIPIKHWELDWDVAQPQIRVRKEVAKP